MLIREVLLSLVVLPGCAGADKSRSTDGMHCFDLPKIPPMIGGGVLEVRKPDPESRDLLLVRGGTHFYDHQKKTLTIVEPSRWKEAKGAVTDYAAGFLKADASVVPAELDGKLILDYQKAANRQIPTKGEVVIRVSLSCEGRLFSALTRNKAADKGETAATHYIELFRYPDGEPIGKPYEPPFKELNNIEPLCWSSGDTHLVVCTRDQRHICIIEIPEQERE